MRLPHYSCMLLAMGVFASAGEAASQTPAGTEATARCVDAHMTAQKLRRDKQLIESKASMRQCAVAECPTMVQQDCLQWLQAIDEQTPSVVFSVVGNGQAVTGARVTVDGNVVDVSQGVALPLNPGPHTYEVTLEGFRSQSGSLNVLEGQRYRMVSVELDRVDSGATKAPPLPVAPMEKVRPTPTATWVLLGVGVAGLGAFGGMALVGKNQEKELRDVCSPNCTDQNLASMRGLYLGADIAAGVGAAAIIAGGVVYLTRPTRERPVAWRLDVRPTVGGAQTTLGWSAF